MVAPLTRWKRVRASQPRAYFWRMVALCSARIYKTRRNGTIKGEKSALKVAAALVWLEHGTRRFPICLQKGFSFKQECPGRTRAMAGDRDCYFASSVIDGKGYFNPLSWGVSPATALNWCRQDTSSPLFGTMLLSKKSQDLLGQWNEGIWSCLVSRQLDGDRGHLGSRQTSWTTSE